MTAIAKEKVALLHYTLKNDAGEVLDSSRGKDPLGYIHGIGNLIPGLEAQLEGKLAGEHVQAVIAPEDAYGAKNDEMIQKVPLSQFDDPENVAPGVQFQMQSPDGQVAVASVVSVEDDVVTFDMNHPLAGETLHFDVEIIEVRDASAEELDHGHVHGVGGHTH